MAIKVNLLIKQISIIILIVIAFIFVSERYFNKEYDKMERSFPVITKADTLNDKVINIDYPEKVRVGAWHLYFNLSNLGNRSIYCHEQNGIFLNEVVNVGSTLVKRTNSDTVIVKNIDKPDYYFILLKESEDPFE